MRPTRSTRLPAGPARSERPLDLQRAGRLLGVWQARELRIARGFSECHGLTREQLEDIYQEAALAMLQAEHESEEHLQGALRSAIKNRALHAHRDRQRHRRILAGHARELTGSEVAQPPEHGVIAREDRLVVAEFLTELTQLERRVFWQTAEGMSYRAIATALGLPVNEARNLTRSCERKRERFQLLYDTGRLCGYRSATITAIKDGQTGSEELARRAVAHLQRCAHCRAEHHLSAGTLRDRFQGQAAIVLPVLGFRLGRLQGLAVRARVLAGRTLTAPVSLGRGLRERGTLLLGAAGTGKLAAGAAGVVLIAGGAIGATQALTHSPPAHRTPPAIPSGASTPQSVLEAATPLAPARALAHAAALGGLQVTRRASSGSPGAPGHAVPVPRSRSKSTAKAKRQRTHQAQVQPGGFAYLGVPGQSETAGGGEEAAVPTGSSQATGSAGSSASETKGGGGPFSP